LLVSVVIPFRDLSNNLISACLESVSRQTISHEHFEVVLVAHGADRSQIEFVDGLISANWSTLQWKIVENKDPTGTLNSSRKIGVDASAGEFIFLLDGDDMITSDCLEQLTRLALAGEKIADLTFGAKYRLSEDCVGLFTLEHRIKRYEGEVHNLPHELLRSVSMCNILIRRECLSEVFDIEETFHEDACEYPRLLRNASFVKSLGIPTYYYRERLGSITKSDMSNRHLTGILNAHEEFIALLAVYSDKDWVSEASRFLEILSKTFLSRCAGSEILDQKIYESWAAGIRSKRFWEDKLSTYRLAEEIQGIDGRSEILSLLTSNGIKSNGAPSVRTVGAKHTESSRLGDILHGKVALLCFADYHVEQAAEISRGRTDIITIDFSGVLANGARKFSGDFARIILEPKDLPLGRFDLSTASLIVTFNDTNPFIREALEYRLMRGFGIIGYVEGVIDFHRILDSDKNYPRWKKSGIPYRKNDKLFTNYRFLESQAPGREMIYIGDNSDIALAKKRITDPKNFSPKNSRVMLNLNFTYGVEEEKALDFLASTAIACRENRVDFVISRHPMDRTAIGEFNSLVSQLAFNELFENCNILVTRFSGLVPKALVRGLEVIYVKAEEDYSNRLIPLQDHLHVIEGLAQLDATIMAILDGRQKNKSDFLLEPNVLLECSDGATPRERFSLAIDQAMQITNSQLTIHQNAYLSFPRAQHPVSRKIASKQLAFLDIFYESISKSPKLLKAFRALKPAIGPIVDRIRARSTR
jgi:glycosyltransferase involved in cell wall biosynthesis